MEKQDWPKEQNHFISKIPDGIFKELIIEQLSASVSISSKKLTALISKMNKKESMRAKNKIIYKNDESKILKNTTINY